MLFNWINKNFWQNLLMAGLFVLFLFVVNLLINNYDLETSAATKDVNSIEAYALDTIAGSPTVLKSSRVSAGSDVVFWITQPDGDVVKLAAQADVHGVAKIALSDYYTYESGIYFVSASFGDTPGSQRSFQVFCSEVSEFDSTIDPLESMVSINDSFDLTIRLLDEYENAVDGHIVELISSRGSDQIFASSNVSDENGEVTFRISSDVTGKVSYSAYDVTSNKVLSNRANIVYFDSYADIMKNKKYSDMDEDYSFDNQYDFAAFGNSSFGIDHFEFEKLPLSINPGDSITFDLTAYDAQDQVVTDYAGTVRFSALGENSVYVDLPSDYEFVTQDLGSHTFSLATSFQQPGSYLIEARDIDEFTAKGNYTFEIIESTSLSLAPSSVSILSPVSGTYSNNIQAITGQTLAGETVKIFDNDIELATVVSDLVGGFSYTTSSLIDGEHVLKVAVVNEIGTIVDESEVVTVIIDTAAPTLDNVVIEPAESVNPGVPVTVKMNLDEELSQAALLFDETIYELLYSDFGYYETSFIAPSVSGSYALTFIVVDELGNESRFENAATLKVGDVAGNGLIGDVKNLQAIASDHRVTLTWSAPDSSTLPIKNYRVFYGISPNQLTEAVDTFTNSTTWYIPNLKNDIEYYFAIVALDEKGNASEHFSNIVVSVPTSVVFDVAPPEVNLGYGGSEAFEDMESDVSDTGPEILWLLVLSALGGFFYTRGRRKSII